MVESRREVCNYVDTAIVSNKYADTAVDNQKECMRERVRERERGREREGGGREGGGVLSFQQGGGGGAYFEGSQPEWCISSMIYSRDTPLLAAAGKYRLLSMA